MRGIGSRTFFERPVKVTVCDRTRRVERYEVALCQAGVYLVIG